MKAHITDVALYGTKHKTPLPGNAGLVPTRGQALFIFYFFVIEVVFSCVGLQGVYPNPNFPDRRAQLMHYIENRLGIMTITNMSLIVLYSSRNNLLLLLTNWQHSTFLLLHRWVCLSIDPLFAFIY